MEIVNMSLLMLLWSAGKLATLIRNNALLSSA
jgi:hypothetical protein